MLSELLRLGCARSDEHRAVVNDEHRSGKNGVGPLIRRRLAFRLLPLFFFSVVRRNGFAAARTDARYGLCFL